MKRFEGSWPIDEYLKKRFNNQRSNLKREEAKMEKEHAKEVARRKALGKYADDNYWGSDEEK